jgi:hypothetical protein
MALYERMAGCYTPSAGTVYPTLQLLEDQGYVRGVEAEGKKVYEITPEGLKYLEEHRDLLDEIVDRVRETVRDFTGGAVGELQGEFARLARTTFRLAWRRGPDDPCVRLVAEILKRAADDIERAWQTSAEQSSTTR